LCYRFLLIFGGWLVWGFILLPQNLNKRGLLLIKKPSLPTQIIIESKLIPSNQFVKFNILKDEPDP
jgi:hypothetical protein